MDSHRRRFEDANKWMSRAQSRSTGTKTAAKKVLEHLSETCEGRAAQMAKEALQPKPDLSKILLPGFNLQWVFIRVKNGVMDVDAQDGERAIKIHEAANGSIQIELTEKKNGKEQTKKYKADSGDQLKKKHPDAYKIYQEYAGGKGKGRGVFQFHMKGGGMAMPREVVQEAIDQLKKRAEQNKGNQQHLEALIGHLEHHKQLHEQK